MISQQVKQPLCPHLPTTVEGTASEKPSNLECCNVLVKLAGFLKNTDIKSGEVLIKVTESMIKDFNAATFKLKQCLGAKFPLHHVPFLKLPNCSSFAMEGTLISKDKMMNNRIRKCNPQADIHHQG